LLTETINDVAVYSGSTICYLQQRLLHYDAT
jgi:hypothetical protein